VKSVLVTGATGFIGRQTIRPLLDLGFEVHAVFNRTLPLPIDGVTWHRVDLLSEQPDLQTTHLLHLAWYAEPVAFWDSPLNRQWLRRSIDLLDRFRGTRAVVAGSCAEYDWSAGLCVERQTPLAPRGVYGACKDILRRHLELRNLSSAWARIFFVFGPYEPPQKLIGSTVCALLAGQRVRVSALQRRDFLYVEEAGAALASLLDSDVEGPVNIGSGEAIAIRSLAEDIAELVGRRELLDLDESLTVPEIVLADVTRLSTEVGFSPHTNVAENLAATVKWWRSRRVGDALVRPSLP
jgi:nucleoside-diphosphate-sugar epimerase